MKRRSKEDRQAAIHGEAETSRREDGGGGDRPSILISDDQLRKIGLGRYSIDSGDENKGKTHRWSFLEPHPDDPCLIGIPLFMHWSVGTEQGNYLCPRFMAKELKKHGFAVPAAIRDAKCPICEEADRQVEKYKKIKDGLSDEDRKAEYSKVRELNPYNGSFTDPKPNRYVSFIIDENDLDAGPQVVELPRTVYVGLIEQADDPDTKETLDILDCTDKGFVFSFKRSGKGREGVKYSAYKLKARGDAIDEQDLDTVVPFLSILNFVSYDELNDVFTGMPDEEGPSSVEPVDDPPARRRRSRAEEVADDTRDEIGDQFEKEVEEQEEKPRRRRQAAADDDPDDGEISPEALAIRDKIRNRKQTTEPVQEPDDDAEEAPRRRRRPSAE